MRIDGRGDRIFRTVTLLGAVAAGVTLVALVLLLCRDAAPAIAHFGPGFLGSPDWDPVHRSFGALAFLAGTVASAALALVIAVPIGLGSAIYLSDLAPRWLRRPIGLLIELLAALPSVVYGLWGLLVLAPWLATTVQPGIAHRFGFLPGLAGPYRGVGLLAAGLVLAIMILPTIASISRDVIAAVPSSLREAGLALGATRWEVLRFVVLPRARSGIIGAVLLGLGRALGETMAVTMVIGNRAELPRSLFAPAQTLAGVIANQFMEATETLHLAALVELALVLLLLTLVLHGAARLLVGRSYRSQEAAHG
jgi:phosphate transport system permease protein